MFNIELPQKCYSALKGAFYHSIHHFPFSEWFKCDISVISVAAVEEVFGSFTWVNEAMTPRENKALFLCSVTPLQVKHFQSFFSKNTDVLLSNCTFRVKSKSTHYTAEWPLWLYFLYYWIIMTDLLNRTECRLRSKCILLGSLHLKQGILCYQLSFVL